MWQSFLNTSAKCIGTCSFCWVLHGLGQPSSCAVCFDDSQFAFLAQVNSSYETTNRWEFSFQHESNVSHEHKFDGLTVSFECDLYSVGDARIDCGHVFLNHGLACNSDALFELCAVCCRFLYNTRHQFFVSRGIFFHFF